VDEHCECVVWREGDRRCELWMIKESRTYASSLASD
jgi:hypothetical protein